ncbi:MAG: hypothetical protein MUF48_15775 [Pirellulaceae bacterium]|nr:hypothetical protein [Pirellulaceae bacterium]
MWYREALKNLPPGLWQAKAELRLDEVKKEYGDAAVNAVALVPSDAS